MEIKGTIIEISETKQVSEKLVKRELVIEYAENPQYPEFIKFELIGDRTKLLDNAMVGDEVEVYFNLRGRPWTDKDGVKQYFNSLQAWKIRITAGENAPEYQAPADISSSEEDDLPF